MLRCAEALVKRGVAATDIRVSLERNMRCGVAPCGHCQPGPFLLCGDVRPTDSGARTLPVTTCPARIGLDDLVEDGFGTLIHHKDTAVKILVHP